MSVATLFFWLVAVLWLLSCCRFLNRRAQYVVAMVVFSMGFIPLGALNLMQHWHSFVGHLSVLSFFYYSSRVINSSSVDSTAEKSDRWFLSCLMISFYVFALGFSSFDPYRFGFSDASLVVMGLSVISISMVYNHRWQTGVALFCALLAYALDLLPSNNVWDYFIDPLFCITLTITAIKTAVVTHVKKRIGKPLVSS